MTSKGLCEFNKTILLICYSNMNGDVNVKVACR